MWVPIWSVNLNTHSLPRATLQQGGGYICPSNATLELHWNQRQCQRQRKYLICAWPLQMVTFYWEGLRYFKHYTAITGACLHHPVSKDECQHFGAAPKRTFTQRHDKVGVNDSNPNHSISLIYRECLSNTKVNILVYFTSCFTLFWDFYSIPVESKTQVDSSSQFKKPRGDLVLLQILSSSQIT